VATGLRHPWRRTFCSSRPAAFSGQRQADPDWSIGDAEGVCPGG
jgi:hypothetical protein